MTHCCAVNSLCSCKAEQWTCIFSSLCQLVSPEVSQSLVYLILKYNFRDIARSGSFLVQYNCFSFYRLKIIDTVFFPHLTDANSRCKCAFAGKGNSTFSIYCTINNLLTFIVLRGIQVLNCLDLSLSLLSLFMVVAKDQSLKWTFKHFGNGWI